MNARKAKALRALAKLQVGQKETTYEIVNEVSPQKAVELARKGLQHYGTLMLSPNCTRSVYKALKLAAKS